MSRNERSKLREDAAARKHVVMQHRKPDVRVRRTHERLGSALVALIQEKSIDDVTVQEVLDRASVGRSTFYLHFRDKNDLLLSQLEKFLEMMSTALSLRKEKSQRVVPVAEMFAHIGEPEQDLSRASRLGPSQRFLRSRARLLCPRDRAAACGIRASSETSAA